MAVDHFMIIQENYLQSSNLKRSHPVSSYLELLIYVLFKLR